jgi:hypothetical protein
MKKHLFWVLVSALFVSMLLAACPSDGGGGGGKQGNSEDIYALDISKKTDWDYLVFDKTGSSLVFNVDKSTGKPSLLYLRPKKNSDNGYTILFKENGLPDKVIRNGYIMCFDNFKDYTFDVAIIYPDNSIEYHYDIQTDIDFNKRAVSTQGRSAFSDFTDGLSYVSLAIDISTCVLATVAPPLLLECVPFLVVELGHIAADHFLDGVNQDIANTLLDALDCASSMNIGGVLDVVGFADACISAFTGLVDLLVGMDNQLVIDGKFEEVEEATEILAGDYQNFDIKVTMTWTKFNAGIGTNAVDLDVIDSTVDEDELGIMGDRPYDTHGYKAGSTSSPPLVIYWPKGKALAAGPYRAYAQQISSGQRTPVVIRIYAFGKSKTYKGEVSRGAFDWPKWARVASFDNNGIGSPVTPVAVTGVTLNRSALTLSAGDIATLTAAIEPTNATNKNVTWSSSNTSVATVTNGTAITRVTAVAAGNATITATTADGSKTAICAVTVTGGGVGPSPSTEYTGSYTGTLYTSDYSVWIDNVTLTANSIRGEDISISNVRIYDNKVIDIGTWAYVYSGSVKIGIIVYDSTSGILIFGRSWVDDGDWISQLLSSLGIVPVTSDMGDYYQGYLEKK